MPDPVHDSPAWFEAIYAAAQTGERGVPWDRQQAHPDLASWLETHLPRIDARAIVVGCGLGDDAEAVAKAGYGTTAFDVSPSAIESARQRHPDSKVAYTAADLLALPNEWREAFDLVVEIWTVQAMPMAMRDEAIRAIGQLVAPDGTLLVIANSRPAHGVIPPGPPWPLSREEMDSFGQAGLSMTSLRHDGFDRGTWTATFRRQAGT